MRWGQGGAAPPTPSFLLLSTNLNIVLTSKSNKLNQIKQIVLKPNYTYQTKNCEKVGGPQQNFCVEHLHLQRGEQTRFALLHYAVEAVSFAEALK